uniref:FAD-dependent oxidoreductase n=1 Tax=Oscillatoriales cyanobacterium SpSt-402 TaxID=2282168 RepID=A0A832GY72_9CYAN
MPNTAKHARICVVGAGAAGLSTAYFLKQRGYENVTVLEKNGRVGGLCCSITYKSRAFDLGANYLTPAYKEVLKMAQKVGADLYSEGPGQVYDPFESQPGKPVFKSILDAVMQGTDFFTYGGAIARFYWERLQLEPLLSVPGFAGISLHPELTQPFSNWLAEKNLSCLSTLFELPITNMGYGYLNEIPTAYALKYMTLDTFTTLVTYGADLKLGWPKRFVDGFQRFWERISWGLEVHCNVTIKDVKRGATIQVHFLEQEQILDQSDFREETLEFDYLILACPLTLDVLHSFLDLSTTEQELFKQIELNPYSLTTYRIPNFKMHTPVTNVIPMNPEGNPWFISQQFLDNDLVAFYTRLPWDAELIDWDNEAARSDRRNEVIKGIQATMETIGVRLDDQYYTYDEWPYFPHVTSEAMQAGFYDRLEALQGQRKTFYVGGLLNFELVETIVEYSKALVEKNF